jgi:signal transduction histidine kinase/CheY-like chemotaxis protein
MKYGKRILEKVQSLFRNSIILASILFFASVAMVLFVSVNSNIVMDQTITMVEEATQQRLLNAAIAASLYVTAEELDRYRTPEDTQAPEYRELQRRLIEFSETFSVLYVYYWRDYGDGRIQYIVDNDLEAETQMTPANFFELDENARKTLAGEMTFTKLAEYTPTWSGLISAFAPVYDRDGNLYCIAGVDISDEIILIQRDDSRLFNMIRIVALAVSVISSAFSIYLYNAAVRGSRKASVAKSNFLANTSHEIRTPMNAVLGITELLLRKDLPEEAKDGLVIIKQAGTNLLSIINDVLDFSKIEAGKFDILEGEYRFASLLNDTINIIRIRLGEKPVRFTTMIDGKLPAKLLGDEMRVRQILLNLLSNAVKYTPKGSIVFSIRGEAAETRSGSEGSTITLCFEVKDTGIGIKAEDMNKLFNDFTQLDSKRNRNIEGTGLGLAISRNLCHLMGGSLTAESVYGEGSVFTARIPQKVLDEEPFAWVENAKDKNCLIYEKRRTFAQSIIYTLESLGVSATFVDDKDAFFAELQRGVYQFVFVPWPAVKETLEGLKENTGAVTVAAMMEYGKKIPPGCRELYMPTQPVMVANILNGKSNSLGFQDVESPEIRFIAPQARVLAVDDIAINLDVVSGLLASYEITVDKAGSGSEAIEMTKKRHYDLILMDHMMPGINGIEAAEAIRSWEMAEHKAQTPIIALTANAISGMREMFLKKGFNDYLSKPIEIAKLDAMIAHWIPPEKKIKTNGEIRRETLEGEVGIAIPGVDTRKGINMTGGSEAGYRKALSQFRKDAAERLPLFAAPPGEDAFGEFAFQAHAIKGAAGTIGAAKAAAEAEVLERAGRAGNAETIRNVLPSFYRHLTELIEGIGDALSNASGNAPGNASGSARGETGEIKNVIPAPTLHRALPLLRKALETKHMREIDRLLEELEKLSLDREILEAIDIISDKVLLGEYGAAVEAVNSLSVDPVT